VSREFTQGIEQRTNHTITQVVVRSSVIRVFMVWVWGVGGVVWVGVGVYAVSGRVVENRERDARRPSTH
jgi:hypothetical protein